MAMDVTGSAVRRWAMPALVAAATMVALVGVYVSTLGGGDVPAPASPATTDPRLEQAGVAIDRWAREHHNDSFAGVVLSNTPHRLVVYRVPGPGFDNAVQQQVPDVPLEFRDATHSARELTRVADQIMRQRSAWEARGVRIVAVAPLPDGSAVDVATLDGSAADRDRLFAQYPGLVAVRRSGPIVAPLQVRPGPNATR